MLNMMMMMMMLVGMMMIFTEKVMTMSVSAQNYWFTTGDIPAGQ